MKVMDATVGILFLLLLSAGPASANEAAYGKGPMLYSNTQCPVVPQAFEALIGDLKALKVHIKNEAKHCVQTQQEFNKSLDQLSDGLSPQGVNISRPQTDFDRFMSIITMQNGEMLSPQDTQFLTDFLRSKSAQIVTLLQTLNKSGQCFEDDRAEFTWNTASTLVSQLSEMASQVAGPYGMPIQIGGTVLKELFSLFHQLEMQKTGYDFDEFEQQNAYGKSLCLFHEYRTRAKDLLYSGSHMATLAGASPSHSEALDSVLEGIQTRKAALGRCTECSKELSLLEDQEDLVSTEAAQHEIEIKTFSVGRVQLRTLVRDIGRFFDKQNAKFIEHYVESAVDAYDDYLVTRHFLLPPMSLFVLNHNRELGVKEPVGPSRPEIVHYFMNTENQAVIDVFDADRILQKNEEAQVDFEIALDHIRVVDEYCGFLSTEKLPRSVKSVCYSKKIKSVRTKLRTEMQKWAELFGSGLSEKSREQLPEEPVVRKKWSDLLDAQLELFNREVTQ